MANFDEKQTEKEEIRECYICQTTDSVNASCHWCEPAVKGMIGKWICDKHCVYIEGTDNKWAHPSLPLSCCLNCVKLHLLYSYVYKE